MTDLIKESVIKILEILSTAEPVIECVNIEGESIPTQYVIDLNEVNQCKELLKKLDPDNQQLRGK